MKRKHWQGYGVVNMILVRRTSGRLEVRVSGNHEYGLEINRGDNYTLAQWMGTQYHFSHDQVAAFSMHSYNIDDVEHCDYIILLRS